MPSFLNNRPEVAAALEHSDKLDEMIAEIKSLKEFMAPLIELAHVQLALLSQKPTEAPPAPPSDNFLQ